MDISQIMELMENRNKLEREWADSKKKFLECPKCNKLAVDRLIKYNNQINSNIEQFERQMYDGSLLVNDPSRVNAELERKIAETRNGKGLQACTEKHRLLSQTLNDKIRMIETINDILERVK